MAQHRPTLGFWLFAGIAATAGVACLLFAIDSSRGDKETVAQSNPETRCTENWKMCRDNADLVNYSSKADDARHACIAAVNEAGKYGHPKWCSGWLCEDFANYETGTNAPDDGLITLIDDHVQMQNGSGARIHSTTYCTYNIRTDKVVTLNIGAN
ncbi:MAG: hypothetical protein WDN29_11785 [Methylovirgula sp.]